MYPTGWLKIGKLPLSPEQYVASFRTYRAAKEVNLENYFQFYGSNVPDTVLCEPGAAVRVLGIGSGSGEIDIVILKKLLQRHNSVYNRVVEPSEDMIGRYKNVWEQLADGGYMFIAMQSDKSGLGKLGHKLKDAFVQGDPLNTPFCLSGDVKQWLDAMTISYVTSEDENYHVNVTECLKEDSETGSLL
ncbi:histamine N-methyltransferase-like [Branchiostoma floridae x Branchiostoma belcheri]